MRISEEQQRQLEEYKRKVLSSLRKWLIEDTGRFPAGSAYEVTIEDLRLERTASGDHVIILFREASRPGCLFGFGTFAVEPKDSSGAPFDSDPKYAEMWASIVLANFEEELCAEGRGLPDECDPESIAWI